MCIFVAEIEDQTITNCLNEIAVLLLLLENGAEQPNDTKVGDICGSK